MVAFPFTEQRVGLSIDAPAEVADGFPHLQGIGSCRENTVLMRLSFAAATIFMAFVIFWVFLTEAIFRLTD